ncbi:MAG: MarR family transcriptional regulator [Dehalococcoidales bacterium]|nr:MarR family transcriptional regulator [Dehalococcoidales bacterium]
MDLGLTVPQFKSLSIIASEGCINLKNLAVALGVTPSNVTGIVERLVEHGLVNREVSPDDRRVLLVRVTPEGDALIGKLRETRVSHMAQILAGVSVQELDHLRKAFRILLEAVEAYTKSMSSNS